MKSRKIISALTAIAMSVASWQCFSVFAEGATSEGKEILKYTFDSKTEVTKYYSENDFNGSLTFSCYDGQTEPFLRTTTGSWASGWFADDTGDSGGRVPSEKGMNIANGKLNVTLLNNCHMKVRIPTTPGTGEQKYKIEFTMTKTDGGQYLRLAVDDTPKPDELNEITEGKKGGMVADFKDGPVTYSKIVSLSSDVEDHYLAFILPYNVTLAFSIDELTVTQVSSEAFVSKTVPAKGAENVTTYAYPKVYFAKPIDPDTASNITLKDENGNAVETTKAVDNEGKVVTLKTNVPLNGNKTYTIDVPDTVKGADGLAVMPYQSTFKTAYENVVVSYDFEKEGNQGDNGMMFKPGTWESTLSLAAFDGHNALKIDASQQWGNAKLQMTDTSINNPNIEGNNINRTYLIEFDLYIPRGSGASVKFTPVYGTDIQLVSDSVNTGKWMHVRREATFKTCWSPRVEISNNVGAGAVYIDNFKVVDISKKAAVTMTKADNGKVSATAENIQNTHGSDATFWLIQAVYCGDKLVDAVKEQVTVGAADTSYKTLNSEIGMPEGSDYSVKAFLWDMSKLNPLTALEELRN